MNLIKFQISLKLNACGFLLVRNVGLDTRINNMYLDCIACRKIIGGGGVSGGVGVGGSKEGGDKFFFNY